MKLHWKKLALGSFCLLLSPRSPSRSMCWWRLLVRIVYVRGSSTTTTTMRCREEWQQQKTFARDLFTSQEAWLKSKTSVERDRARRRKRNEIIRLVQIFSFLLLFFSSKNNFYVPAVHCKLYTQKSIIVVCLRAHCIMIFSALIF